VMGIGMLLQARVASMMLKGRSEKTMVDDLEGEGWRWRRDALVISWLMAH